MILTADEMIEGMLGMRVVAVGCEDGIFHITGDNGITFYFTQLSEDGIQVWPSGETYN
jgi:hypothetical protein